MALLGRVRKETGNSGHDAPLAKQKKSGNELFYALILVLL